MNTRTPSSRYVGRFAPSPTGPLHAGSLVAAMGSYLDARAHEGRWLLRIEDLDPPREAPGAKRAIVETLRALGFEHDGVITMQSERGEHYQRAFDQLRALGLVYPCACTRREIADSADPAAQGGQRGRDLVYPGTCRNGIAAGREPRAWRVRVDDATIAWRDRDGTHHSERLAESVGDFVLRRADGFWAYQLAVVVDDALQKISDVVRGEDLRESTARQIFLQRALGFMTPRYLHLPLVLGADGEKLSKQNGATPIEVGRPLETLARALAHFGLEAPGSLSLRAFWQAAIGAWRDSRWMR
jgi:glutamyl-Q tRNA(Asp) synthetase